jgi:hypothetical protein
MVIHSKNQLNKISITLCYNHDSIDKEFIYFLVVEKLGTAWTIHEENL